MTTGRSWSVRRLKCSRQLGVSLHFGWLTADACHRSPQLELLNMGKTGELKSIWQSASNTNVQFNLVSRGHPP